MVKSKKPKVQNKRTCTKCEKQKNDTEFYVSYSPLHNGKIPVCKSCILEQLNVENVESVKDTLRMIDRPFLLFLWESSLEEAKNQSKEPFGLMMKNLGMKQYRELTWKDSVFESAKVYEHEDVDTIERIDKSFLNELIIKFGRGYSEEQYMQMEKFYDDMIHSRNIDTPEHKKLLIIMCRLQTKIDIALENDDITTFEKLHKQYQDLIKNSGFRPIDKTASDVASGIRTFSQIFAEVEKDGFITPNLLNYEQDIVDRSIQYLLNYQLKLMNQQTLASPPVDTPKVDD